MNSAGKIDDDEIYVLAFDGYPHRKCVIWIDCQYTRWLTLRAASHTWANDYPLPKKVFCYFMDGRVGQSGGLGETAAFRGMQRSENTDYDIAIVGGRILNVCAADFRYRRGRAVAARLFGRFA